MSLTAKQSRFIDEYVIDLNGKEAAIRAGYSRHSSKDIASQLLVIPEVAAAVDAAKLERSIKLGVDAEFVLKRLTDEVNADLADLYDDDGKMLPVEDWPLIFRTGLVSGIETEELFEGVGKERVQVGIVRKIKLSDRIKRLELIGKHVAVNAFQDVVQVKGVSGLAERLERAQARKQARHLAIDAEFHPVSDPVPSAMPGPTLDPSHADANGSPATPDDIGDRLERALARRQAARMSAAPEAPAYRPIFPLSDFIND